MASLFSNRNKAGSKSRVNQFELVFKEYFVRLCGFATVYTGNSEESKEIVQEVFLKVWEKQDVVLTGSDIKSYLFRAVKNACINNLQHKIVADKYQAVLYFLNTQREVSNGYEKLEFDELNLKIQKAIGSLPESCRQVFLLSRDEGLKYREIAEKLEISVKTVETQMSRALVKLKDCLGEYL